MGEDGLFSSFLKALSRKNLHQGRRNGLSPRTLCLRAEPSPSPSCAGDRATHLGVTPFSLSYSLTLLFLFYSLTLTDTHSSPPPYLSSLLLLSLPSPVTKTCTTEASSRRWRSRVTWLLLAFPPPKCKVLQALAQGPVPRCITVWGNLTERNPHR